LFALLAVMAFPLVSRAGEPTHMRVGVTLDKLGKLDLATGAFNAEFFLSLTCNREPCKPDFDVTNGKITGHEPLVDEPLHKEWRIKSELEGYVDLSEFPFDHHVLTIGLVDKGDPLNVTYEIDPSTSTIDNDIKLPGWSIDPKIHASVEKHALGAGLEVEEAQVGVGISRPRLSAFFKTLVPVFFMVFVAGFTLLLKPKSAAGRLTTASAGLMTVVMFHLSATSSLPPMGYLTLFDKFMIATYFLYLLNIALSVAMVRFEEKKKEKWSELSYLIAAGAVPGVALIAWVLVFTRLV
jgi:hypothetical protein